MLQFGAALLKRACIRLPQALNLHMKTLTLGLLVALSPLTFASSPLGFQGAGDSSAAEAPRLVVFLAVDQLIPEQMVRLEKSFTGGLARIRGQAARFDGAALPYSISETGPGHATMATGCLPRTHGIVGNSMRSRRLAQTIYCVADPSASTVTSAGVDAPGSYSAKNIMVPCMGDHMKGQFAGSKVFAVSVKDRAAVSMAGHSGDGSFWWDRARGGFVSSTAFAQELPSYVNEYNASWAKEFSGFAWKPVFDGKNPPEGTEKDDRKGESGFGAQGRTFPYTFAGKKGETPSGSDLQELAGQVAASPIGDRVTLELAAAILVNEDLGMDAIPDFLGVSLSSPDKVGHSFGPYSMEVTDALMRMDKGLESFFQLLDARVGEGRWVLAFTADHGVLPLPEGDHAVAKHADKHRVGKSRLADARKSLDEDLVDAFGPDRRGRGAKLHFGRGDLYFDLPGLEERGIDAAQARFVAAASMEREDWVWSAYTFEEMSSSEPTSDPYLKYYRNAFSAEYSPDVAVLPKPGTLVGWKNGTTHGSAHSYDRRVPLYFLGSMFERGNHVGPAGSHDIVPTMLRVLGVQAKGVDGQVLEAAFVK